MAADLGWATAKPRTCRRHVWITAPAEDGSPEVICGSCYKPYDPVRAEKAEAALAELQERGRLFQVEVSEAAWSLGRDHPAFDRLLAAVTRYAPSGDEEARRG